VSRINMKSENQLIRKVLGPVSITIGVLISVFWSIRNDILSIDSIYVIAGISSMIIGISLVVYRYVEQSNLSMDKNINVSKYETDINEFRNEISDILLKIKNNKLDTKELDRIIKEKITFNLENTLKDFIDSKYGATAIRTNQLEQIEFQMKDLQSRISFQIERLSRSGTINLIIGSLTTIVAIGVLINLILSVHSIPFDTTKDVLIYLTPRLSLAIFIEIFSFFFLKLYKQNLEDVKYFHNERTNIDSKVIALKASMLTDKDDTVIDIIKAFSNVERNFILKKGESTVNIERVKIDNEQEIKLVSKMLDIVKNN